MKTISIYALLACAGILIQSCASKPMAEAFTADLAAVPTDTTFSVDTRGYWENGQIIKDFDCPDAVQFFPAIDIKDWHKVAAVSYRLPSYKETLTGKSIHTYGGAKNREVKPYAIALPKLAYFLTAPKKFELDPVTQKMKERHEMVVVIQMVQTATDTLVGFRYLTGGCGGSGLHNFHFLTDEEVKEVSER